MQKLVLLSLVLCAACGDDGNTSGIPDPCNPLGGEGCLLPWPSATYLKADTASMTGFRVDLPVEAMPKNEDGEIVQPDLFNRYDGFTLSGPMLVAFPSGVSPQGLPSFKNIDESLSPSAPIALIDIDRGERTPFMAEIDQNVTDIAKRDLIIRPLARLRPGTRYVVAIKKGVKAADGGELASPPGFEALRDGKDFSHPRFAEIKKRWPAIFDKLATLGIEKGDLVLAWDFVTASDEFMRSDLTTMRAKALPVIGTDGANLSFAIKETQPNLPTTYKRYLGTYKAPDFLTAGETDPSILRRGADGLPENQGLRDAQFAAIIPNCVTTGAQPLPRPTVIFGHGLFGSAKEYLDDDFVGKLAEDHCLVIIAGDFIGLTSRQLQLAPLAVNDMNRGRQISEKLAQSIIDFISLESVTRGKMAAAAEFKFNGQAVIDPQRTFYIGGSLGGIMGNTLMAYDPNFKKGVLAVPGGIWSMLFERSAAWFALLGAAQGSYKDPAVYQLVVAILGLAMEPYDPITTAAHVIKDPLFGQAPKDILMWYTVGDCLVTNISTEVIAREMGIKLVGPAVKEPWKLPPTPGPLTSGITLYNAHPTPLPPDTNQPPSEDNGTHSGINKKPPALRQVQQFLFANQVVNECKVNDQPVPCDCAVAGACD
ncbi:MAG: hypothetical protein JNL83_19620 [Myxococcales bacterium]|nr:hypothetical protein [Myxococcales bacterium]